MIWKLFCAGAAMLLWCSPAWAAPDEIEPVVERERQDYALSCKDTRFMPGAFWSGDINKDGLTDAIVQSSAIACDNEVGADCDAEGCPMRLYVQTDSGRFSNGLSLRDPDHRVQHLGQPLPESEQDQMPDDRPGGGSQAGHAVDGVNDRSQSVGIVPDSRADRIASHSRAAVEANWLLSVGWVKSSPSMTLPLDR